MSSLLRKVSKASGGPFWGLLLNMYKQVESKKNANEAYVKLKLILDDFNRRGYKFSSPEVQAVVEMLAELPAYGANQRNFRNLYLRDSSTLSKLPSDPKSIPKGHWH